MQLNSLAVNNSANPVLKASGAFLVFIVEVSDFLKDVVGLQVTALLTRRWEALWKQPLLMESGDVCFSLLAFRHWLSQWSHPSAQVCCFGSSVQLCFPRLRELRHSLLQVCRRRTPLARCRTTLITWKAVFLDLLPNYLMGMQCVELFIWIASMLLLSSGTQCFQHCIFLPIPHVLGRSLLWVLALLFHELYPPRLGYQVLG